MAWEEPYHSLLIAGLSCVISQHATTVSTSQDHRYICNRQNSDWALET
jgi:hypothetical protein